MKIPTLKTLVQVLGGLCLYWLLAVPTSAVTNTWDSSGVGSVTDGGGTWSTGNANWWNGATDAVWPNGTGDAAIIGNANGAAGTISVSGTLNVNSLILNAPGSGNYTISGGTLTLSGTTPSISNNVNATITSTLAGTGGLVKTGAGMLTLSSAAISYTGNTTVNNGTLFLIGAPVYASPAGSTMLVSGNGVVTNTPGVEFQIGSTAGAGTLTVTNNGYVAAGILYVGRSAQGTVNLNGGTITGGDIGSDHSSIGTTTTGTWNQTGGNAIFNGLLQVAWFGGPGIINLSGGTFSPNGLRFGATGNAFWNQTGGTAIIGAGGVQVADNAGLATMTISGGTFTATNGIFKLGSFGSGQATATVANTGLVNLSTLTLATGIGSKAAFNVDGGTLRIGIGGVTYGGGGTGTVSFNGGTFQAGGNMAVANNANLLTIVNAGGAIMDTSNFTMTVNSALTAGSGSGGLSKYGSGTLTLNGTNTYIGSTAVNAGTLIVNGSLANNDSDKVFVAVGGNVFNSATPTLIRTVSNVVFSTTPYGSQSLGSFGTKADLVDSSLVSGIVTMQWRTANSAIDIFPVNFGLGSDVLRLGGLSATNFVLQISYNSGSYTQVAATGQLSLDWFNGATWTNAVAGNVGGTANFVGVQAYNSSLFNLGTWGVDTNAGVVWAVLNHSGDFAVVVPEPSAFVLLFLACGILTIQHCRLRRV